MSYFSAFNLVVLKLLPNGINVTNNVKTYAIIGKNNQLDYWAQQFHYMISMLLRYSSFIFNYSDTFFIIILQRTSRKP